MIHIPGLMENTYTASNSSATYTVQNSQGCDSVITLNLNIGNSSFSTDIQSSCGPFTWIDGNTYTSSNNSAKAPFKIPKVATVQ